MDALQGKTIGPFALKNKRNGSLTPTEKPRHAMLFSPFGCTNLPPPVSPFLLMQNQSPKDQQLPCPLHNFKLIPSHAETSFEDAPVSLSVSVGNFVQVTTVFAICVYVAN